MSEFKFYLNINPNSSYFIDFSVIETITLDQEMLLVFLEFLELFWRRIIKFIFFGITNILEKY